MTEVIISENELIPIVEKERKRSKTFVFASGVFDLLHEGHTHYLKIAKTQGDILVVFVHTDSSTKRMKGDSRPIQSLHNRMDAISLLDSVDYVIPFDEETPFRVLQQFKPDVMVRSGFPKGKNVQEFVESYGGKAFYTPLIDGVSTTAILEKE